MRRMKKRVLFSLRRKYDELSILPPPPPLFTLARPNGEPGGAGGRRRGTERLRCLSPFPSLHSHVVFRRDLETTIRFSSCSHYISPKLQADERSNFHAAGWLKSKLAVLLQKNLMYSSCSRLFFFSLSPPELHQDCICASGHKKLQK